MMDLNNNYDFYLEQIDYLNESVKDSILTFWFRPQYTGYYEDLHKKLLRLVDKAKNIDRINYLQRDASIGIKTMNHWINIMEEAQKDINKEIEPKNKVAAKMLKRGNTPEKTREHINWINTVYRPALSKKKNELKK